MRCQVISARDGAEGVAQVVSSGRAAPIDLVIVDLVLPVRGGIEVIEEMKKVNPKAPIVVTTGQKTSSKLLSEAMKLSSFLSSAAVMAQRCRPPMMKCARAAFL